MPDVCPICEGMGMRIIMREGVRYAEPCECREQLRAARLEQRAGIPARYQHCDLNNYMCDFGVDPSLPAALAIARGFVREYPHGTEGKGLLLSGSIGVGKTHLAAGILRGLIEKGVPGLFCDYRELLKEIQHSYNPQVATTELEILRPVFNAEVLVLDELGAQKPTDWVWDTVALILNTRYNDKLTTIITTNYGDQAAATPGNGVRETALRAVREESLSDRIGERMRSRLAEMCVVVEMSGHDFRRSVGRARFAQ
jgi:DNA replication protein DnaC